MQYLGITASAYNCERPRYAQFLSPGPERQLQTLSGAGSRTATHIWSTSATSASFSKNCRSRSLCSRRLQQQRPVDSGRLHRLAQQCRLAPRCPTMAASRPARRHRDYNYWRSASCAPTPRRHGSGLAPPPSPSRIVRAAHSPLNLVSPPSARCCGDANAAIAARWPNIVRKCRRYVSVAGHYYHTTTQPMRQTLWGAF